MQWGALFQLIDSGSPFDYPFVRSDIAMLHSVTADPSAAAIDPQTWQDLMLDQYSDRLGAGVSIFGQQVLHQRLRAGLADQPCAQLGERLAALNQDRSLQDALRSDCQSLRKADCDISALLFGDQPAPELPAWSPYLWMVGTAFAASIGALCLTQFAWFAVAGLLFMLIAIQARFFERIERWNRLMPALQQLLRVVSLLGQRAGTDGSPLIAHFAASRALAGQINRRLTRSPAHNALPGLRMYADWFALGGVAHYFKGLRAVMPQLEFLRQCYRDCANLEADLALARHLARTSVHCRAERVGGRAIELDQFVHPLLEHAAPLTLTLGQQGAFISGQNGIGKSTMLRAVGLNLVTARAFGFCYAQRARVPALPVYTSMQSEDSLLGGESLYIAELRRAQELLAASSGSHKGVCIIDEIFRGTNHLESISAAAAVLQTLAERGPVIVSSHNLVLAPLLAHGLTPLCVSAPGGDTAKLTLQPGVLADTNGIALLATRGFDPALTAKAGKVFNWLEAYLMHPSDCADVLDA